MMSWSKNMGPRIEKQDTNMRKAFQISLECNSNVLNAVRLFRMQSNAVWLGSVMVTCQTCNPEVAGSTPSLGTAK